MRLMLITAATALVVLRGASAQAARFTGEYGGIAAGFGEPERFEMSVDKEVLEMGIDEEMFEMGIDEEMFEMGIDSEVFEMGTDEEAQWAKPFATQKTAGGQQASGSWDTPGSWDTTTGSCPAGQFWDTDQDTHSCQSCDGGRVTDTLAAAGATTCTACAAGTYSAASTAPCATCEAGSATGTLAAAGATTCTACAAGTYSAASTAPCATCEAGSATSTLAAAGATTCTACSTGYNNTASTTACAAIVVQEVQQEVIVAELSVPTAVAPTAFKDNMAAQLSLAASSTGGVAIRAEDIVITAFEIASAATADPIGCENGVFTTAVRSQFVVGTKDATGAATVEVTGDPVCVAARRLLQVCTLRKTVIRPAIGTVY
jgi:hypothetical protein